MSAHVEAIFIAPAEGGPTQSMDTIEAVAGKGVVGDRYYEDDGLPPTQQLTLIQGEHLDPLAERLGPGAHRRQVVTRGIELNPLVGREFRIGSVRVRGVELCEPCNHLAGLTYTGVVKDLVHRGGLNAEILAGGTIAVGDVVAVSLSSAPGARP